jgi:hypothetical protein
MISGVYTPSLLLRGYRGLPRAEELEVLVRATGGKKSPPPRANPITSREVSFRAGVVWRWKASPPSIACPPFSLNHPSIGRLCRLQRRGNYLGNVLWTSALCATKKMGAKRLLFPPIWERDQYLTLPRLFSVTGLATVAGKSRLSRIFYRLRHVSAFLVVLTGLASLHKHLTSSIPQPHFPTAGDTFLSRPYPHEVALHATRGSMSCGVIPYFSVKACGGYATVEQKDRATPDRTISRDVC